MNNHRIIIGSLGVLGAATLAGVLSVGFPATKTQQKDSSSPAATQQPSGDINRNIQRADFKMSDLEFNRLKVKLPAPINKPWKGSFFDSSNCFDPDKKRTALSVLPGWIRKALQAGDVELAASYLWSLKTLAEETDPAISSGSILAIYLLGDFSDFARTKIKSWITNAWSYQAQDTSFGQTEIMDIRARVLRELDLANDRSFDDFIYDTWTQSTANGTENLDLVDYAYYLEKNGRKLPAEYWLNRLNSRDGFTNAIEVVEKNGMTQATSKITSVFERLRETAPASAEAGMAALAAAASFRLTGEPSYKDYLIERTREQLGSGSFESSLSQLLEGLAMTNNRQALDIVSEAMTNKNAVIREMAIDALGENRDPYATNLLFEAAMQKTKNGTGFPARELRALLAHNEPDADSKYIQLQQALLSGHQGWTATTSDFSVLEFIRNHRPE